MDQNKPPEMTDNERKLLIMEYEQLCQDYRQHDKYVLDKLSAAGILFALLGVAIAQIHDLWTKIILLFLGGLFGFICTVSVAKDTYFRDGYGKIITGISKRLGIWDEMKKLNAEGYFTDSLKPEEVDKELLLLRHIHIDPKKSSIKLPDWLRSFLVNQKTFRWILVFYIAATISFWGILIAIIIGHFMS